MAILDEGWQSGGVYAPPIPRQRYNEILYFFSFYSGTADGVHYHMVNDLSNSIMYSRNIRLNPTEYI